MRTTIDHLRIFAVLALLVASVACGSHSSPTAPSSASSATTAPTSVSTVSTGATIVGTVSSGTSVTKTSVRAVSTPVVTVTVVGTSVSATVDSGGSFTLTNVPASQVVLNFSGVGIDASVPIGTLADNDHVQIGVTVSGTTATLDSVTSTTPTSSAVSMKGVIASIGGACPSLSLSVGGTTVQTSGATTFSAKSCADLVIGPTMSLRTRGEFIGTVRVRAD